MKTNRTASDSDRGKSLFAAKSACAGLLRSCARWSVAAAGMLRATAVFAQQPAAEGGGEETTVIVSGRSLYVEGFLIVLMCGVALYAVCRSSSRN